MTHFLALLISSFLIVQFTQPLYAQKNPTYTTGTGDNSDICIDPPPTLDIATPWSADANRSHHEVVNDANGSIVFTTNKPTNTLKVRFDLSEDQVSKLKKDGALVINNSNLNIVVTRKKQSGYFTQKNQNILKIDDNLDLGATPHFIAEYELATAGTVLKKIDLSDGDEETSKSTKKAGATWMAPVETCITKAFKKVGPLPSDMPPIKFPEMHGCSDEKCVEVKVAWIKAHHHTWRAHQIMEKIATFSSGKKEYAWRRPGRNHEGELTCEKNEDGYKICEKTAPSYWFGSVSHFNEARGEVIGKIWKVIRTAKTGGIKLHHKCPSSSSEPGNVCFTKKPSAHHIVKGWVNYCKKFFESSDSHQTKISIHEPTHHLFLNALPILDNHTHAHGVACVTSIRTEPMYGEENIRHLVTYQNKKDNGCYHRGLNMRNVDTYAYYINQVGNALLTGKMATWPAWGDPTPKAPSPETCPLGEENCQCADTEQNANSLYGYPDGDYRINKVCYDHDGEMSCEKTEVNASEILGICKRCNLTDKAAGCECQRTEECASNLFCFGGDPTDSRVKGHCYKSPPPSWACLADCNTLFGHDIGSYCYNDYVTGARCFDSSCQPWDADKCQDQGKICRFGKCITECLKDKDCGDLGYPTTFKCISNSCRWPNY